MRRMMVRVFSDDDNHQFDRFASGEEIVVQFSLNRPGVNFGTEYSGEVTIGCDGTLRVELHKYTLGKGFDYESVIDFNKGPDEVVE